nr:hypothetical protein [Tanacetum cinerariifolium]
SDSDWGQDVLRVLRMVRECEGGELKDEALNCKAILEESMNIEEESSNNARTHYSPIDEWEDSEQQTMIMKIKRMKDGLMNTSLWEDDDDDVGDIEYYLIRKDPPYNVNEEEE